MSGIIPKPFVSRDSVIERAEEGVPKWFGNMKGLTKRLTMQVGECHVVG